MRNLPSGHPDVTQEKPARIRFGGMQTPHGFLFELSGRRLCLDFTNTLDERLTDQPVERLRQFGDLVNWALQAGAINRREARMLCADSARRPRAAEAALRRATAAREAIFAVFSAVSRRLRIPGSAIATLTAAVARTGRRRHLERRGTRFVWEWQPMRRADPDVIFLHAAWSAVDLLTSPECDRVRQCKGTGCAWLFIDTSRNSSRRWCDMTVCGNRTKARRYYARVKRAAKAK